jgi:S1-C subfamily serine protease
LQVTEQNGLRVKSVLRASAAEQAGLAAGDEWLGIEVGTGKAAQGWRLSKLDELPLYLGQVKTFKALITRNQRLMTLQVTLPDTLKQVKLSVGDPVRVSDWLGS